MKPQTGLMTPDSKTVPLTLPTKVWGRLVNRAEHHHTTVGDMLADAIKFYLSPDGITQEAREALRLHKLHRSNNEIARQLGIDHHEVAGLLMAFGVRSQDKRGGWRAGRGSK